MFTAQPEHPMVATDTSIPAGLDVPTPDPGQLACMGECQWKRPPCIRQCCLQWGRWNQDDICVWRPCRDYDDSLLMSDPSMAAVPGNAGEGEANPVPMASPARLPQDVSVPWSTEDDELDVFPEGFRPPDQSELPGRQ